MAEYSGVDLYSNYRATLGTENVTNQSPRKVLVNKENALKALKDLIDAEDNAGEFIIMSLTHAFCLIFQ